LPRGDEDEAAAPQPMDGPPRLQLASAQDEVAAYEAGWICRLESLGKDGGRGAAQPTPAPPLRSRGDAAQWPCRGSSVLRRVTGSKLWSRLRALVRQRGGQHQG